MVVLSIAISPCPNDTYVYDALIHGRVPDAPECTVTWVDIEHTNTAVQRVDCPYTILKISYGVLPYVHDAYGVLPCGGAFGYGVGPLVVHRPSVHTWKRIAIPDVHATATVLLHLWLQETENVSFVCMRYSDIVPAVQDGTVDAGVVIHEARGIVENIGLRIAVDLGSWWAHRTSLPVPLGAIAVRRQCDWAAITRCIRSSLMRASLHDALPLIMRHAQYPDIATVQAHIDRYVNAHTYDIGDEGILAVSRLCSEAQAIGLFPPFDCASKFLIS